MVENVRQKTLVELLASELHHAFPNEEFLRIEIEGVLQGLINSIRWTAVKTAYAEFDSGNLFRVESITTVDHFSTDIMPRADIVNRICDTSGLDEQTSSYALGVIEKSLDERIKKYGAVQVEYIGTITQSGARYVIDLSEKDHHVSPMTMAQGGFDF